jgi:hypothetical protein
MFNTQCLVAARDGHGAESSLETFVQLYKLEDSLTVGAIANATMVKIFIVANTYNTIILYY